MPDGKTGYRKSKEQAKLDCGAVFRLANKGDIKTKGCNKKQKWKLVQLYRVV